MKCVGSKVGSRAGRAIAAPARGFFFSYFSLDIWINYQPKPFLERPRKATKTGETSLPHSASTLTEERFKFLLLPDLLTNDGVTAGAFSGPHRFFSGQEKILKKRV